MSKTNLQSKRSKPSINLTTFQNNDLNLSELSDDHDFLLPKDILPSTLGLFFLLRKNAILKQPFSKLYHQWGSPQFHRALSEIRGELDPNTVSEGKCIVINRWLSEYRKNPEKFTGDIERIYTELTQRMSISSPVYWDENTFENDVKQWRDRQIRRRLFYFAQPGPDPLPSILTLKDIAAKLFMQLIEQPRVDPNFWYREGRQRLKKFIDNCFIIVGQPTWREGQPAIQYEKLGRNAKEGFTAKVHVRMISLLDPQLLNQMFRLSSIRAKVYPVNHQEYDLGEEQPSIEWKTREITSSQGNDLSFLYCELNSIVMKRFDAERKGPLYNSKSCRLEFKFGVELLESLENFELSFASEPFYICSHPSYFRTQIASMLLDQLKDHLSDRITPESQQQGLLNFIAGYHISVAGVEPNQLTHEFLRRMIQEVGQNHPFDPSGMIYEKLLAKIIAQIESYRSFPFLSLMYHDGLFLGICDPDLDEQLQGEEKNPSVLMRFRALTQQDPTKDAIVRFITHCGYLDRATFDKENFINRICILIFESTSLMTVVARMYPVENNLTSQSFQWYYDDQLHRISKIPQLETGRYKPIVPSLPTTRQNNQGSNARLGHQPNQTAMDFNADQATATVNPNLLYVELDVDNNGSESGRPEIVISVPRSLMHHRKELKDHMMRALNEFVWFTQTGTTPDL